MVIPMFREDYENKSLEELVRIRRKLWKELREYEDIYVLKKVKIPNLEETLLVCPSPETVYWVKNEDLKMITDLIREKLENADTEVDLDELDDTVIFKYKYYASNNFLTSDTDGFEVIIRDKEKNNLTFKKVSFEGGVFHMRHWSLKMKNIKRIKKILEKEKKIFEFDSELNNHSCDGCGNTFLFSNGKEKNKISIWNLHDKFPFGKLDGVLAQEKYLFNLFKKICNILKQEKIKLTLNNFEYKHTYFRLPQEDYYYLSVTYDDTDSSRDYYYISEDTTIKVGDKVVVDRRDEEVVATVVSTRFYKEFDVPFPVNETKYITGRYIDIPKLEKE